MDMQMTIPLSSCGTQTVESSSDRLMLENTVVIQADPMVQDSWDSARKITCDWQSKLEKMVTFAPFGVSDLLQVAEVKFAGSGDNVRTRMEIQVGRGPFAPPLEGLTKIGDELTVVVYAEDNGAGYDILVKNCYAYDNRNFNRANKIRLLNDHGCLFRPHQMEYFKRTFDTRSTGADIIAFARMNAFKFPDKMDVFLSCELEMCKGGCDTHCEMQDYPIDIMDSVDSNSVDLDITTFRPSDNRKVLKGVKRRRKSKKFAQRKVEDEPVTLSPEIMQLLEELGAEEKSTTEVTETSEQPFRGNTNNIDIMRSTSTSNLQQHSLISSPVKLETDEVSNINSNDIDNDITDNLSKMSFSTFFAGTHSTSDSIPQHIVSNKEKFKPSELLSATMEKTNGLFDNEVSSLSKEMFHTNSAIFPPRLKDPEPRAFVAPAQSSPKHSNGVEKEKTESFSMLNPSKSSSSSLPLKSQSSASQPVSSSAPATSVNDLNLQQHAGVNSLLSNINSINQPAPVNTLQQQLQSEGQFVCGSNNLNSKCNPNSQQMLVGGFLPVSTTPKIFSSTVIFTSPRSVEKFQQQMSNNPGQPKEVLIKIVDSQEQSKPDNRRNPRSREIKSGRPRFGSRLQSAPNRFSNFFGKKRRRRDTDDDWIDSARDVFAESETVNMIKGFQVVSAADLAFDPKSLNQLHDRSRDHDEGLFEEEICFPETSFYAGLLVACSLLMISGLVSVCSIRQVRKYQRAQSKKQYFGAQGSSLSSYS